MLKLDTLLNATVNPALKRAMIAGETLAPKIPDVKFDNIINARESVVSWMRIGMQENIFDVMGNFDNTTYTMFRHLAEVNANFVVADMPQDYPWSSEEINAMTIDRAVFIMLYYSYHLIVRQPLRHLVIENITLAYCALSKRGIVTEEFCTKIQNSLRDELGVTLTLNQNVINALYKGYLLNVNDQNAQAVFADLSNLIPDITLRLKLTLNQAAGSGLTLYVIIGRALRMYRNFQQGRVNILTGGELQNWNAAQALIGNNEYYGFKRDMGAARLTLYKSLGYVARELLVRINGERTLMRYAGLAGNIKNKNALDLLISQYVE